MVAGLLDTDILVDLLRQYRPAHNWLGSQQQLGVSAIVWVELLQERKTKPPNKERLNCCKLFNRLTSKKMILIGQSRCS